MRAKLSLISFGLGCLSLIFVIDTSTAQTAQDSTRIDTTENLRWMPSPKSAMIRSLLFPGWGQWYNGKKLKAALAFATETGIIGTAIYWNNQAKQTSDNLLKEQYIEYRNSSYWFLAAAILLSMGDAYVDAHLAGFDVSSELANENGFLNFSVSAFYRF